MTAQANGSADSPFVNRGTRMFLTFVVLQLALHLGSFISAKDPRLLMPHVVACLQDLLLLTLFWFGYITACRLVSVRVRSSCRILAISGLFGLGLLLASYPLFLREYLAFPVNVFATDTATVRVFVLEYLGIASLWPVAVALALGIASPASMPDCSFSYNHRRRDNDASLITPAVRIQPAARVDEPDLWRRPCRPIPAAAGKSLGF